MSRGRAAKLSASRRPAPPAGARLHRACEVGAIALAAALALWLAARAAAALRGPGDLALVLAALLAAAAAADLVSGFVHWWADRVADEASPWLGRHFVQPFRDHHEAPVSIAGHGFVETNGNTCIAALPALCACALLLPAAPHGRIALFAVAFVPALACWVCLTNQIHKWAHAPRVPRAVRWAQRAGWILAPLHHAAHHVPPFDRRFCITTGWCDGVLDRVGLFAALERRLAASAARAAQDAAP